MKKILPILFSAAFAALPALADVVYVSSSPLGGCTVTLNCPGPNTDGTYSEVSISLGDGGARGTGTGRPSVRPTPRAYLSSTSLADTNAGVDLMPQFGVPGAVYQIDYNFSSTAGNVTTNIIMSATCQNGTLSFTQTDKFQSKYGTTPANWTLVGYVTNSPGSSSPIISFRYQSGLASASLQNRLIIDTWRFTQVTPCLAVPVVGVTGPLSSNVNRVVVTGVSASATAVTVYQDSGSGMMPIGSKTSGVTAGNNTVTVSGVKNLAQVAATQTIGGQEGCVPTAGILAGQGANGGVRVALTIRETADTGPVGAPAVNTSSGNLHFLGASTVASGAPVDAMIVYPSNDWQTLTFKRGFETIGGPATTEGTFVNGTGYNTNDYISIQVYAYRTVQGTNIFSAIPGQTSDMTSNDVFQVQWTWSPVEGAEGYRLLRSYNFYGYYEYLDVTNGTMLLDNNTGWVSGNEVTPSMVPTTPSVQWNPTVGNPNNIGTPWGILESINFAIAADDNTGPFDIYIDNIQNGTNIFQTFENALSGTTDYAFRAPSFSGTTSANLLPAPNVTVVANSASDTGTKALRVQWQWSGTNSTRWLRLTTSGAGNPLVFLDDPIIIRMLVVPVGTTPPLPPGPIISQSSTPMLSGSGLVLNWPGRHRLLESTNVAGPYTTNSATVGPITNSPTEPQKFFRLRD